MSTATYIPSINAPSPGTNTTAGNTTTTTATSGSTSRGTSGGPLGAEHLAILENARRGRKKIDRAILVAGFNGWTLAVFAAVTLPMALFDPSSGLVAIALGAIAWREFHGKRRLRQLDPAAPRLLGLNQVCFCALLTCYCGWKIATALLGPGHYADEIAQAPELAQTLEPLQEVFTMITLAVYGCVLLGGVLMQGLTAVYYFTRTKYVQQYLEDTPQWVIDVLRVNG